VVVLDGLLDLLQECDMTTMVADVLFVDVSANLFVGRMGFESMLVFPRA